MARSVSKKRTAFSLGGWLKAIGLSAKDISSLPNTLLDGQSEYRADAPSPHIDAILQAIEKTDKSISPLIGLGMDPKVAVFLKQMETTGAIHVRTEDDQIWIDMYDKDAAQAYVKDLRAKFNRS